MSESAELYGKRVLVTGASGFIGSNLCAKLEQLGASVHAVSRKLQERKSTTANWHQLDLVDTDAVRKLFSEISPDFVCHLASEVTGSRDMSLVIPTLNSNLVSTVNLLVAATEFNSQRILAAGSLEEPDADEAIDIPSSPYAAAKLASSIYARMFNALYDTPIVLARLFMVYGPAQRDLKKLVPYVVLSLLRGQQPELSSGKRPVDWIYVDDVVNGLVSMLTTPGLEGSTVELGSGKCETTGTVAEMLNNLIGNSVGLKIGALADRPLEQVRVANISKSANQIGWQPEVDLQEGLQRTVEWYRNELESGRIKF